MSKLTDYYSLWINESPDYFTGWMERKGLENYFYLRKQENHKAIAAKYQADAFALLKLQFDKAKKIFNKKLSKDINTNNNLVLGGDDLLEGYSRLSNKTKDILKEDKENEDKVNRINDNINTNKIITPIEVKNMIKDMETVEVKNPRNTAESILKSAINFIGKPIADRVAKKELNKFIRNVVGNKGTVTNYNKNEDNSQIKESYSYYKVDVSDYENNMDMSLTYTNNYNTNKKVSQLNNLLAGGTVSVGTLQELADNILYDESIDNNKRAVIYNTAHSSGTGNYYAEYRNLRESLAETYADKALRQLYPNLSNGLILINGELINLYSIIYNEKLRGNKLIDIEAMLPKGLVHTRRRSYSLINYYKKFDVQMQIKLKLI